MKENKQRTSLSKIHQEKKYNNECFNESFNDNMDTNILRWYKLNYTSNNDINKYKNEHKHSTLSTDSIESKNKINSFPKRSGAASVLYKDYIYIFGGYKLNKRLNDFYKYDILKNEWIDINNLNAPSKRENNPSFVYKDKMYIIGGYEGNMKWVNDFYSFDLCTETWENVYIKKKSKLYAPTYCFGYALSVDIPNGILYIFGGYDGTQLHNTMHAFNLDQNKWIRLKKPSGDIPSPRSCAVGHICDGYFYIFGGYNGFKGSNSLYQYHLATGIWTKIKYNMNEMELIVDGSENIEHITNNINDSNTSIGISHKYRNSNSCTISNINSDLYDDDVICNSDSSNNRNINSMTFNSNDTNCCYISSKKIPSPRYFMGSFLHNNCIYILGGFNGITFKRLNDLYKYDIHNRTWEKIHTTNNFSERSSISIHFYKNVIYCIAGFDGIQSMNDVYALKLENIYIEPSSLEYNYKTMINNYKYSDIVFILQNKYIYGCSNIILARCPSFKYLYDSYLLKKDSTLLNNKINNHIPITINDIEHDIFLIILNYIYTDEIYNNYSLETYLKLLVVVSNKFYIIRLIQLCESIITKLVNNSNVFDILLFSYRNDCKQLCKFCIDYVIYNNLLDNHKINFLIVEPHLLGELYKMSLCK
ncbi:Kelch motif/Galactose oxidase, central domain/BTB/POZ domain containing protein, putative [Hepatocystis sp. ex Piliocolobus tephrosceles]|uniref:Leucine-zipper-like transcriptional regulator 1 homolog n=1 Tax=Piliocolobus tephrosceles TaxID=591936 RepID=A0A8C9GXK7_9PRIM|nr:Kelch motif/Galactose oxidase, central domain/BTB/POZ domain containing protein, putative [Hepatocystis sp. ex Piliocolobus tephrosceles]